LQKGKYFKYILKSCGDTVYKKFVKISIQKAIISFFELVGLAGLFSIITILLNENSLDKYRNKVETIIGLSFSTTQFVTLSLFGTLLFFVLKNLISFKIENNALKLNEKIIASLNEQLIRNYFTKGYWHLNNEKMFNLTHKASVVPGQFGRTVVKSVWQLISEFTILVFFLVLAFSTSFTFSSLLILLSIPVTVFAFKRIKNVAKETGSAKLKQQPKTAREQYDLFIGFIEMKIYGSAEHFITLYLKSLDKLNKLKTRENRLILLPKRLLEVLAVLIIAMIYLLHTLSQNLGFNSSIVLDVGLLGLFGYKVLPGVARIIESLVQLGSTEMVRLTLYQNLVKSKPVASLPIDSFELLEFQNVNFAFGDKKILENFFFTLKKGEIIGIMGESGTGKSTMAKIILGLIKADSGEIRINGTPTSLYLNESWQKMFGYIGADAFMIDGTLFENIAFNKGSLDRAKIHGLLDQCQLSEYKENDIQIGEMGNKLSSGLKQRMALARALYHDPEILILDEFSSNLDYKNEDELLTLIEQLVLEKSKTVLIISHRPRTMRVASKVYELENGKLRLKIIEES
jgi:ATP-binding cassette subfamily B protein